MGGVAIQPFCWVTCRIVFWIILSGLLRFARNDKRQGLAMTWKTFGNRYRVNCTTSKNGFSAAENVVLGGRETASGLPRCARNDMPRYASTYEHSPQIPARRPALQR